MIFDNTAKERLVTRSEDALNFSVEAFTSEATASRAPWAASCSDVSANSRA